MQILTAISPTKQVIAAEVGSVNSTTCSSCKAGWIANGFPAAVAKWPQVVAFVYFDYDMTGVTPPQPDWRLQNPPNAAAAYKNLFTQTTFQGSFGP